MLQFIDLGGRLRGRPQTLDDDHDRFPTLLGECGYVFFPVNPKKKSGSSTKHALIFHKENPTVPLHIFKRRNGKWVVRQYSGSGQIGQLKARLVRLVGEERVPSFVVGATMKPQDHPDIKDHWSSWLTEATKRKLRKIGVKI